MDIKLIGRLGELLVEKQLFEHGWHPVRLDTAQMASNADLVAIKGMHRVSLQVKTANNATSENPFSLSLAFGYYGTSYLHGSKPMFNSKPSPLVADIVVGVSYGASPRFVVLPVALAEKLCRKHFDYWYPVPKKDGSQRSPSFPFHLRFPIALDHPHVVHLKMMRRNLLAFENHWDLLSEPPDRLHDKAEWSLQIPSTEPKLHTPLLGADHRQ